MPLDPYDHHHSHVEEIPWSRLGKLLIKMAEIVGNDWRPEVVVGIAKGGVIPAVFLSSILRVDFFPIKLSCRYNEEIVCQKPVWHVFPIDRVKGKKVLLVDDIVIAGRTLGMATKELITIGAKEVRTATLAAHHGSVQPDYVILVTDALIVWPWDRDTLTKEGGWSINPEYLEEMEKIPGFSIGPSPAQEAEGHWLQ